MQKNFYILFGIFLLAITLRFLYFPTNVYFGYDQARDSYASLEILEGHLKLIGPPSSVNEALFHGPFIYYIYAPIYFFFHHSPEAVSFVFRIINALGIFFTFCIGAILFNKKVGLLAALFFALSYEQTQYSLFLSHPSLGVLSVLIYYLGLSLAIFKKINKGLIVSAIGLGFSIQFHYVNSFLILGSVVYLILFRRELSKVDKKITGISLVLFLLTILSFLIAQLKFNFPLVKLLNFPPQNTGSFTGIDYILRRLVHDNFIFIDGASIVVYGALTLSFIYLFKQKDLREKLLFLGVWFLNGLIVYFLTHSSSYYYNPGTSISLIIFVSFLIFVISKRNIFFAGLLLVLICWSNVLLITTLNKKGPNPDIVIQPEMLTVSEKNVLDFCYEKAQMQPFALNALTVPLFINTTWSYLFEWYGLKKYHYLPIWGGKLASGFYNKLQFEDKRSSLPNAQCLIIEPTVGIPDGDKENFLREENYFSILEEERKFGTLTVQFRKKI